MAKNDTVTTLTNNVLRLLKSSQKLKDDNAKLVAQLHAANLRGEQLHTKIKQLEDQLSQLIVGQSTLLVSSDAKVAKARINSMIKTIDTAIAQLNK
ncbi:MAG: hypothetical protein R3Y19_00955 [Rikenellaceae bacterium]